MRIATFNINNVVKRLPNLLAWLADTQPDVVCLQELKATDAAFPAAAIEAAGYGWICAGQRTWNGVAILARGAAPIVTRYALPGDPADDQARYIEAAVRGVLVASIYAPNGNPNPGPKFAYKLAWLDRLTAHAAELMAAGVPVALAPATLQRENGPHRGQTSTSPTAGRATRSSTPPPAGPSPPSSPKAGPTPCSPPTLVRSPPPSRAPPPHRRECGGEDRAARWRGRKASERLPVVQGSQSRAAPAPAPTTLRPEPSGRTCAAAGSRTRRCASTTSSSAPPSPSA